jgi:prepilin-type N-terminal cleavage/methylation domain-containing protein
MIRSLRPAFTIIELLVVISIISLLIAILLPALASARNAADVAQSLTNIRQLQFSVHSYAADYKSYTPQIRNFPSNPEPNRNWSAVLFGRNYATDIRVFWGRNRDTSAISLAAMKTNMDNSGWSVVGYSVISANPWGAMNMPRLDLAKPQASRALAMAEALDTSWGVAGKYAIEPATTSNNNVKLFNTQGKIVVAYWDSHARATTGEDIGWNPSDKTGTYPTGNYAGRWTYASAGEFRGKRPWYSDWVNNGLAE